MTLRLLSYLAPSVPASLFESLAAHVRDRVGLDVEVAFDASRSGPRPGEPEPFSDGDADAAFVCATSYVWMTATPAPPVSLLGVAWAPTDPRAAGRAIYFGDVLASADGPGSLLGLGGARVAYNDDVSLSGYHSLRLALSAEGVDAEEVRLLRSGSHLRSLELLDAGEVDAAAIDSTVWRRRRRETPGLADRLRQIAALGPHPVQPVVVRSSLEAGLRARLREALLAAGSSPRVSHELAAAELTGFVEVADGDYDGLRVELRELGRDGR